MGNALATNTVNDDVEVLISVALSSTQNCQTVINSNQYVNITADGSVVFAPFIRLSQKVNANTDCMKSDDSKANIDTAIKTVIKQVAEAIVSNLGAGTAEANNVVNLFTRLQTQITQTFQQNCTQAISQNQTAKIEASNGAIIVGSIY